MSTLAALLDADTIWILVPLGGLMIAVISILINHQQKMAAIVHGRPMDPALAEQVDALRREVQELRNQLGRQALALDDLKSLAQREAPRV